MRIAIDIRRINEFGVGTYIWNLVRSLSDVDTRNEYLLLGSRSDFEELGELGPNFASFPRDTPARGWREHFAVENGRRPRVIAPEDPATVCRRLRSEGSRVAFLSTDAIRNGWLLNTHGIHANLGLWL